MKKTLIIGCFAATLGAFASCLQESDITPVGGKQITLSVGFEEQTSASAPETASTKTFLAGTEVRWLSGDKTIYVFDTEGQKNTFTSATTSSAAKKEFTGKISENSEISSVIWTGLQKNDDCTFENGIFSGSTLKVVNPQSINNGNSFAQTANIAVMKPGDDVLRNVFGYIKYTIPTVGTATDTKGEYNRSNIKSVTFSAAEPLAGLVQIDYTGNVPIAVIEEDNASTSLTVNTRMRTPNDLNTLEAGNLYAVVPVGTYTDFNIKVTLADDTSFDLPVSDPVIIERGKFTSAGTLPTSDPNPSEEPGDATVWPSDPTAFDYGLNNGSSRRAEYPTADITAAGVVSQQALTAPATIGDITYGTGFIYYGNRMATDRVDNNWNSQYPNVIPSINYQSFKINRPGSASFYQACHGYIDRIPTYYMAVVTTVNGVTSAKIVDSYTPANTEVIDGSLSTGRPNNPYADDTFKNYIITLTVSEEDLKGITEAATVYIYHQYTGGGRNVLYYPLAWTANADGSSSVQRKGKFLLAGDSLVREYRADEAPQTGWGQCLSEALGGGVQVNNHAVGGESTKSFIDSGKWDNLISSTLVGDIVMIQFMHNDQKTVETHATDPATTYKDNLKKFIKEVRERGANPVLVTSVLRRFFDSNGDPQRSLGDYPDAMRAVATETGTPLIDCEQWSYGWLKGLGPDGSVPYYIIDKRDPTANDNTHFTKEGAEIVAKFIADEIVRLGIWTK